jgi:hypothetical protein
MLIQKYGLPYLNDLFVLIFVHAHTRVYCLISPVFLCTCENVVENTLSCLFIYYYYYYYCCYSRPRQSSNG